MQNQYSMEKLVKYKKIGFMPGSWDLCHAGHILGFKEARAHCDKLIVGLQVDPSVDRKDKNKPIMSVEERRIILEGIRYIDEIVEYKTESDNADLVKKIKPDIYFMGADWKGRDSWHIHFMDVLGISIHYLKRDHDYSSSNLRKKIYFEEKKGVHNQ
ncbi:MAG: glycerol-3-phosphate cytidylyltransferase [Candidatus Pacebacteria bacterium]|nr:glycerol-3-phosphate cytidylyltransferase [Candidatus Paceibacterota bacterium]